MKFEAVSIIECAIESGGSSSYVSGALRNIYKTIPETKQLELACYEKMNCRPYHIPINDFNDKVLVDFSNSKNSEFFNIKITVISQLALEMGKAAMEFLVQTIDPLQNSEPG